MKRPLLTRTLALFLSLALTLPSPALALRPSGVDAPKGSIRVGLEESLTERLSTEAKRETDAEREQKGPLAKGVTGRWGLEKKDEIGLLYLFDEEPIPKSAAKTAIRLDGMIRSKENGSGKELRKEELLLAHALLRKLEAIARREGSRRFAKTLMVPAAVLLGLVVSAAVYHWNLQRGEEPPRLAVSAVEKLQGTPPKAPEPFLPTVPKKIPDDLNRVEFTDKTISAALQVMLRDPLGPRSLEGLYAVAYLQTTDEKGRRLYIRAGQDRVGSDGLVTFPAKPLGRLAGRGESYVLLLSFDSQDIKNSPGRIHRRSPLNSPWIDLAVEIKPDGSAKILRDHLYGVLPESIQIEKGTLRLKNLPALEGKWIVPYRYRLLQGNQPSGGKPVAPPGQVLEGEVSFPEGEWVKNVIRFVVFDSEKQAQSASPRTQGIMNMNLKEARWIMETTKNFPGSLIILPPDPSRSGLEETDPEVKQLWAEYLQKWGPSERLSLMAQRLPRLTSLQRRQWFQALVWLNPEDVSPLLIAAFLQKTDPLAPLVRDPILEILRDDETGQSLDALEWLLADFQRSDLYAMRRVTIEELSSDPRWALFWTDFVVMVAGAHYENIFRGLYDRIQSAGRPGPELFHRLAGNYRRRAVHYRALGASISLLEKLAKIDGMFADLGLAVEAELRHPYERVLGGRGEERQRMSREIYEGLRSIFTATLEGSSFSIHIAWTLRSLMRLEDIYGYYLNLSPDRSVTGLDHFSQALEYRAQAANLRQAELDKLGLGSLDAGLEETASKILEGVASQMTGEGVLVIGAEALELRPALAGLVRFAPFRNRIIYYEVGPSWERRLRALDSTTTVIPGNDSVELLTALLGKPEADGITVLGNAGLEEFLRRVLPPSMSVERLDIEGTSFWKILSALGAASPSNTIDAAGLEETLARLSAA